eukprot:UN01960
MKKIMKWLKILKWLIFVIVEVKFVILTYQQANINPLWIWKILTLKNSLDETTLYYEQQLLEINRKIMELKDIKIPELTQELEQRQRELDKSLEMIIKNEEKLAKFEQQILNFDGMIDGKKLTRREIFHMKRKSRENIRENRRQKRKNL